CGNRRSVVPGLWKNKRQILVTVIEICLPLLFAAILIALRHRVHSISHPNATVYPPESVDDLPGFFYRRHPSNPWELAYVPSNSSAVRSIAEAVERALPISIRAQGFASERDFEEYVKSDNRSGSVLAAVVFKHRFPQSALPLWLQRVYFPRLGFAFHRSIPVSRKRLRGQESRETGFAHTV
uniref:Uncharacterized protein n=1 Tax=Accipiter nisus TaxID=211598 RepID=A0A8B9RYE9_9AVES